jgi:hypothetical protein
VPQISSDLHRAIENAATIAAVELLAAYRVSITPIANRTTDAPIAKLAALGTVRFSAPGLNGKAMLGASTGILRQSNGPGTSDHDWVAELANQFLGRFKLKLLRDGFELWSMAPVGVSGRLLATAVSQPGFTPIQFQDSRGGYLAVWIDIEISGPIKPSASPDSADIPREGDLILF